VTDPTVLFEEAANLLALLKAGADTAGWAPNTVEVSAGEPAPDCDAIVVWASQIRGIGNPCAQESRVTFTYQLLVCVGADREEQEIFESASAFHDVAWAIWIELLTSCCDSDSFSALVDNVDVGTMRVITNSGGMGVWQGTVELTLSAQEITGS